MAEFLRVLPQRDEIGISLSNKFVSISQQADDDRGPDTIRIHIDDIPMLIDALTAAMNTANSDF